MGAGTAVRQRGSGSGRAKGQSRTATAAAGRPRRVVRASYVGVMSKDRWGDRCVTVRQDTGAAWVLCEPGAFSDERAHAQQNLQVCPDRTAEHGLKHVALRQHQRRQSISTIAGDGGLGTGQLGETANQEALAPHACLARVAWSGRTSDQGTSAGARAVSASASTGARVSATRRGTTAVVGGGVWGAMSVRPHGPRVECGHGANVAVPRALQSSNLQSRLAMS